MDFSPDDQALDLAHLRTWIGQARLDDDQACPRHARRMAATVARPGPALQAGDALPPLWHWLYFLGAQPPQALGPDGHAARGDFLPPVPLPVRMWAGGRVSFEQPLRLGDAMNRHSQVLSVTHKRGHSGDLVFVTVLHEIAVAGRRCVREEHDIVYRSVVGPTAQAAAVHRAGGAHQRSWTPDAVELFRYSALTFNGHRIHYDLDWCRQVEGYADLVVHGPLVATRLAALATEVAGRSPVGFDYRALRPALRGMTLTLHAQPHGDAGLSLWSTLPDGAVQMQAEARFAAAGV